MKRRVMALLLAAAMMCMLFAACGSSESASTETTAPNTEVNSTEEKTESSTKTEESAAEKPTVKIGAILGLSGNNAYIGGEQQKALELLTEELNSQEDYPVHIELIEMDDRTDVNEALTCATKLATQDNVQGVIGPWSTACTNAVSEYLEGYQIPNFSIGSATDSCTQRGLKYYRRCTGNNTMTAAINVLTYMQKVLGWKNIVVVYSTANDFSVNIYEKANEYADIFDVTVSANFEYEQGTTDFTSLLTSIKQEEYDGIYFTNSNQDDTANFIKQAVEMGITPTDIYGLADTAKVCELLGATADGYMTHCTFDTVNPVTEKAQDFRDKFVEKYGTIPSFYAYNAAICLEVMTTALELAETKDAAGMQKVLTSTIFENTMQGDLEFDETGEVFPMWYVQSIEEGKVVTVQTEQLEEYRTYYEMVKGLE